MYALDPLPVCDGRFDFLSVVVLSCPVRSVPSSPRAHSSRLLSPHSPRHRYSSAPTLHLAASAFVYNLRRLERGRAAPATSRAVHQSRCPETAPASTAPLLSARVDVVTDLDGDTASTVSHESLTIVFADDVLEVKAGDCRGAYETRSAFASARPPLHHRWRLPPSSAQPIVVTSASSIIQPRYLSPWLSLRVCERERFPPY